MVLPWLRFWMLRPVTLSCFLLSLSISAVLFFILLCLLYRYMVIFYCNSWNSNNKKWWWVVSQSSTKSPTSRAYSRVPNKQGVAYKQGGPKICRKVINRGSNKSEKRHQSKIYASLKIRIRKIDEHSGGQLFHFLFGTWEVSSVKSLNWPKIWPPERSVSIKLWKWRQDIFHFN